MKKNNGEDSIDKMLAEALGQNKSQPDFKEFCLDHPEAIKSLTQNETKKKPFLNDLFMPLSSMFSKMLNPVRVPIGMCALLVFLALLNIVKFDPSGSSVAWAEISQKMQTIEKVKFHEFKFKEDNSVVHIEGNYAAGKVKKVAQDGTISVDDGLTRVVIASDGTILKETDSEFGNVIDVENMNNLFDVLTKGILQYNQQQIDRQKPSEVADDFLVYQFLPSEPLKAWLDSVMITVGKKSFLPIQMKLFYKDDPGRYDLYIFEYSDYELNVN